MFAEIFTKRGIIMKTKQYYLARKDKLNILFYSILIYSKPLFTYFQLRHYIIGLPLTLVLIWYLSKLGALDFDKSEVKQKSYGTVSPSCIFNSLF